MPKSKRQILRYRIIDRELSKKKYIKTKSIQEILSIEFDLKISQKTVQNDINLMKYDSQLGYFAPIEYSRKKKAYYYSDPDFSILKFGLKDAEIASLGFALNIFKEYSRYGILKNFISAIKKIESTIEIEQGIISSESFIWERIIIEPVSSLRGETIRLIPRIIHAIEQKRKVKFNYQKFEEPDFTTRICIPAWLKEYQGLWYMVGEDSSGNLKTFALDRILQLEALEEYGEVEDVDITNYYYHCFGITAYNQNPQKIVLSFNSVQAKYIKTLPIHHTQKILLDKKDELRIEINVIPSYELYAKLLSYGPSVRVLSPIEIQEKIGGLLKEASNYYLKPRNKKNEGE